MAQQVASKFEWFNLVFSKDSGLSRTSRLVAAAIWKYMSYPGLSCFPSIPTIAADSGLNEKTVRTHLPKLVEAKFLLRRKVEGKWNYKGVIPEPHQKRAEDPQIAQERIQSRATSPSPMDLKSSKGWAENPPNRSVNKLKNRAELRKAKEILTKTGPEKETPAYTTEITEKKKLPALREKMNQPITTIEFERTVEIFRKEAGNEDLEQALKEIRREKTTFFTANELAKTLNQKITQIGEHDDRNISDESKRKEC